jgi:hypothetical protein
MEHEKNVEEGDCYLFQRPRGTQKRSLLKHYATSRKVAGSGPSGVIEFFSIYLTLQDALWPWRLLNL